MTRVVDFCQLNIVKNSSVMRAFAEVLNPPLNYVNFFSLLSFSDSFTFKF